MATLARHSHPYCCYTLYFTLLIIFTRITAQENRIEYSIFEESPAFTYVGDVPGSANLQSLLNATQVNNLIFSILSTTNPNAAYFMIDEKDGILRTKEKIDRDAFCPRQESCILKLDIAVKSPPDYFAVIKLAIEIEDKNDNIPTFAESPIQRSIPENTEPGRSFSIPLAEDLDSPEYGIRQYRVVQGSPEFKLKVIEDQDERPIDLYLVLDSPVDREKREEYSFSIAAVDGGSPPNTGTLDVDIIILDVNDHPPKFLNDTFHADVLENVTKDSVIITVKAVDYDSGSNGDIVYSFTSKIQQDFGELFSIDPTTGAIRVKSGLDFETQQKFTLQVAAQDTEGEWLPAEAKVLVDVLDVNDNPPIANVESLASSGQVEVLENKPKGSYIAFIAVEDPDTGINGQFACSLENPDFKVETMYQDPTKAEYTLVTSKPLDREKIGQYDLDFVCADRGTPQLTSTSVIRVTVADVNDHTPVFTNSVYMASVMENEPSGHFVTLVSATDEDEGKNGNVRYSLLNGTNNFHIDPIKGNITTWRALDREVQNEYSLTIKATDMAELPLTSFATLVVKVKDVNDEAPKFNLSQYNFGISESAKFGDRVGQVLAQDPDLVGSQEAKYSLVERRGDRRTFSISPTTGEIFTRTELDRETQAGYILVVKATDSDNDKLSSTVTVSIYVIDVNDNSPIIDFPTTSNHTLHLANIKEIGKEVGSILAHDIDKGSAAEISFYLSGNKEAMEYFSMHERSGQILTRKPLDEFVLKEFTLQVLVKDSGSPPNTVQTELRIIINSSLAEASSSPPLLNSNNMTIVISVAVVSAVLVIILITAIIVVKRRDNDTPKKRQYLRNLFVADQKNGLHNAKEQSESKQNLDHSPGSVVSKKEVSFSNDVTISDEGDEQHKQIRQMASETGSSSRAHQDATHPWDPAHPNYQFYQEKPSIPSRSNAAHDPDCTADSDSGRGSNEEGDGSSRPSCSSSLEHEANRHNHRQEYTTGVVTSRSMPGSGGRHIDRSHDPRSHDPYRDQPELTPSDIAPAVNRGLLYSTNVQLPRTSTTNQLPSRHTSENDVVIPRPGNIDTRPHNTRSRLSSSYV